jgi:hypothetical protein
MVLRGLVARNATPDARNGKPHIMTTRKNKPASKPGPDPLAALIAIARTCNPTNVVDVIRRAIVNHGVTARNVGRTIGMRVMAFQNHTFARNAVWQLDDCQLAALWTLEYPAAVGRVFAMNGRLSTPDAASVRDAIAIVRGVRADYNRTGHGMGAKPAVESTSYGTQRYDIAVPTATVVPAATKPAARKPALRKTA